jgi:hypothetical protein
MLEIWKLITGRKQHKIGKDGEDFLRKPRSYKGCSAINDDDVGKYEYDSLLGYSVV